MADSSKLKTMLRNYLTIALRNLWRNKAFSAINISGLAIGIATCLVIMLFVQYELSYDRFNAKADRTFRLVFKGVLNGEKMNFPTSAAPAARTLRTDYPEVLEATRLRQNNSPFITYGDKTFKEDRFAYVDSNFFQVFSLPFLKGDPKTALIQPNTIVISQKIAFKYFGNENPIGKVLSLKSENASYKITGVIDKVPANAHFQLDLFASMTSLAESKDPTWLSNNFNTYLVLPAGYNYKQLEAKLPQVVEKYIGPQLQQVMGTTLKQFRAKGNDVGLFLQPLTDIHLRSDFISDLQPNGDIRYVYIFGAIALFMLLIACINFMNLSTAGASKRAREVGIRKVLGSVKSELIRQFLLESILLTAFALLLAIALVKLALPFFNELSSRELSLSFTDNPLLLPGLLLFGLIVGILAGSYPAFFLSSFKPVAVLKGGGSTGKLTASGSRTSIGLRGSLVIFQFFISVTLMVGTTVVYQQLSFIQQNKVGFDKDQVLVLHDTYVLDKNEEIFRNQLLQDPRVGNASISSYIPVGPTNSNSSVAIPEGKATEGVITQQYRVDYHYIPTLDMKLVAGRNFSKDFPTDSTGMIINEAAMKAFGWTGKTEGRMVSLFVDNQGTKVQYHIIGVVKDFHFQSLHQRISPLLMVLGNNGGSVIVKAKTKDIAGLLASMKKQWGQLTSSAPFAYSFMNERFEETYQSEQKIGHILALFAGLTIFVACLGLFGLATFTAEQRTKEIGIRKVLGASVSSVVGLLSKDFLKLVLIANVIAWPLAWWAMNKWLEDFAYRIDISWWVFILAGVSALLIALFTISFQAIKAALANPVKSLRTE